jgi:Zn-finger protein
MAPAGSPSLPPPHEKGVISPAKDCGACHEEIFSMWKDSLHSHAVLDPIFHTSFMEAYHASKGEVKKLCLSCHAPTALITGDYDTEKEITMEGVTCHFCHSLKDVNHAIDPENPERFSLDVGRTIRSPLGDGTGDYHDRAYSPIHKKSELCAGCHEYSANGITIMGTYSEWKNSSYAEKGIQCQTCHMPQQKTRSGSKKKKIFSHYLAGGHSLTQLKKAVKIDITNILRGRDRIIVNLTVENVGSGHFVPTGIPSRKLVVTCKVTSGRNVTKKRVVRYEKIIFDAQGRELLSDSEIMMGHGTQIVKDNRLAPGEIRKEKLVFYMEPAGEIFVSAQVDYIYRPAIIQQMEMKIEMNRSEKVFQAR